MMELEATMKSVNAKEPFDERRFIINATSYLDAIINNLKNRFLQIRIITLLGYFQPQNIHSSSPLAMLELGDFLKLDGHKIIMVGIHWLQVLGRVFTRATQSDDSCLCYALAAEQRSYATSIPINLKYSSTYCCLTCF